MLHVMDAATGLVLAQKPIPDKENEITKVDNDSIDSLDAAFVIIASMGLGGVRKLEIELGESTMVMGQGLLGIFSTQFCHLSGGNPVIAADLNADRRQLALNASVLHSVPWSAPR